MTFSPRCEIEEASYLRWLRCHGCCRTVKPYVYQGFSLTGSTINQTPEQIARDRIDERLRAAGWAAQPAAAINYAAAPGVAVREYQTTISPADALIAPPSETVDYVLTNPPFGKKSSMTFTTDEGEAEGDLTYNRQDFWATTSNKQLNFVQHIRAMLKTTGRAAVVVPDNVLFEGGAGEIIRRKLLQTCDLHTILRLPTGIFYAQGVKANVIFFDNRPASRDPQTREVWYYDYRTNVHHTLKKKPLRYDDLAEFVRLFNPANRYERVPTWSEASPEGRWRAFSRDELLARDKASLDLFWLKDKSLTDLDNLPEPDDLAEEIIEGLEAGLSSLRAVLRELRG